MIRHSAGWRQTIVLSLLRWSAILPVDIRQLYSLHYNDPPFYRLTSDNCTLFITMIRHATGWRQAILLSSLRWSAMLPVDVRQLHSLHYDDPPCYRLTSDNCTLFITMIRHSTGWHQTIVLSSLRWSAILPVDVRQLLSPHYNDPPFYRLTSDNSCFLITMTRHSTGWRQTIVLSSLWWSAILPVDVRQLYSLHYDDPPFYRLTSDNCTLFITMIHHSTGWHQTIVLSSLRWSAILPVDVRQLHSLHYDDPPFYRLTSDNCTLFITMIRHYTGWRQTIIVSSLQWSAILPVDVRQFLFPHYNDPPFYRLTSDNCTLFIMMIRHSTGWRQTIVLSSLGRFAILPVDIRQLYSLHYDDPPFYRLTSDNCTLFITMIRHSTGWHQTIVLSSLRWSAILPVEVWQLYSLHYDDPPFYRLTSDNCTLFIMTIRHSTGWRQTIVLSSLRWSAILPVDVRQLYSHHYDDPPFYRLTSDNCTLFITMIRHSTGWRQTIVLSSLRWSAILPVDVRQLYSLNYDDPPFYRLTSDNCTLFIVTIRHSTGWRQTSVLSSLWRSAILPVDVRQLYSLHYDDPPFYRLTSDNCTLFIMMIRNSKPPHDEASWFSRCNSILVMNMQTMT